MGCCSWNNHHRWLWVAIDLKNLSDFATMWATEKTFLHWLFNRDPGILLKVYHNLYTSGQHNPLDYITQPTRSSFFSWLMFYLYTLPKKWPKTSSLRSLVIVSLQATNFQVLNFEPSESPKTLRKKRGVCWICFFFAKRCSHWNSRGNFGFLGREYTPKTNIFSLSEWNPKTKVWTLFSLLNM